MIELIEEPEAVRADGCVGRLDVERLCGVGETGGDGRCAFDMVKRTAAVVEEEESLEQQLVVESAMRECKLLT